VNAARGDYSRRINWSSVSGDAAGAMRRQIVRFVGGVRGERKGEVTQKQIFAWFFGTPRDAVNRGILDAIAENEIEAGARGPRGGSTVFWITDKGRAALRATKGTRKANLALGLRLILEAAETVEGYTRPGRGIARARQVEAFSAAAEWIRSLPETLADEELRAAGGEP